MKFRSSSRLASGLPMDWHERPTVGGARGGRLGPRGWFVAGLVLGAVFTLLTVASL